jgi:hypothetical protein
MSDALLLVVSPLSFDNFRSAASNAPRAAAVAIPTSPIAPHRARPGSAAAPPPPGSRTGPFGHPPPPPAHNPRDPLGQIRSPDRSDQELRRRVEERLGRTCRRAQPRWLETAAPPAPPQQPEVFLCSYLLYSGGSNSPSPPSAGRNWGLVARAPPATDSAAEPVACKHPDRLA